MLKTRSGLPKHCTWEVDRHGKRRARFRRRGVSAYLTGIPWSEDFMRQYAAALEHEQVQRAQIGAAKRTLPGSFSALCVSYYNSPEFRSLKVSSQASRRGVLERFRANHGHRRLKDLKRDHVRAIIGDMSKYPAAANNLLKTLRLVLNFAVSQDMIAVNPVLGVAQYKSRSDGHHTWTEAEIAQFQATHAHDSRAGLALALALYTAQRRGDILRMGWQHVRGNHIALRQQKTSRELLIPIHPELRSALSAVPRTNMTFLTTERGAPFDASKFSNWFRRMCDAAELPHCSIHGLRKAACRRLAESGCSANEIAAISGHVSLREIAHYTSAASQELLADRALRRQIETEGEQTLPNASTQVYPTGKKR